MKYLGVKVLFPLDNSRKQQYWHCYPQMYLVRLRRPPPPPPPGPGDWKLAGDIAKVALAGAGITSPNLEEANIKNTKNLKNSC